jgi:hypothetical protein
MYNSDSSDQNPSKPSKGRGKKAVCRSTNPLDRTCVHPESYDLAIK